jgi:hypothetical protein
MHFLKVQRTRKYQKYKRTKSTTKIPNKMDPKGASYSDKICTFCTLYFGSTKVHQDQALRLRIS